jgi:hypothetical protein
MSGGSSGGGLGSINQLINVTFAAMSLGCVFL